MKKIEPIYARDTKGRIKVWKATVLRDGEQVGTTATIITEDGLLGGKLTKRPTKVTEGKNIGKANETTPYEQAISEAQSKYNKKLRKGYKNLTTLEFECKTPPRYWNTTEELIGYLDSIMPKFNTDKEGNAKPMLAYPLYKTLKNGIVSRIKFPVFGQRKYNGVRCHASYVNGEVRLVSREGVRYEISHIQESLEKIFNRLDEEDRAEFIFDGELYIHGTILSDITSVFPN